MKNTLLLCIAGLLAISSTAIAQRSSRNGGAIELGADAGVSFGLDDPTTRIIALPLQDFRLGYFMSNKFELEPRFSLTSLHIGGAGTLTTYKVEIGVLLLPEGDRAGRGLYVRPFGGFAGVSASGGGSDSNGYLGGGLGLKIPFAGRRLAARPEANYTHGFGGGGSNQIGLLFGLSYFTR